MSQSQRDSNGESTIESVLSVQEAAALIGITTIAVRDALRRKTLPLTPKVRTIDGVTLADALAYKAKRERAA